MDNDFHNWMYVKTVGGHLKIKSGVVPHRFICQPDKTHTAKEGRPSTLRREQRATVAAALLQHTTQSADTSSSGNV